MVPSVWSESKHGRVDYTNKNALSLTRLKSRNADSHVDSLKLVAGMVMVPSVYKMQDRRLFLSFSQTFAILIALFQNYHQGMLWLCSSLPERQRDHWRLKSEDIQFMSEITDPVDNSCDLEKLPTTHDVLKPFTRPEMSTRKSASSAYKYPVLGLILLFLQLSVLPTARFPKCMELLYMAVCFSSLSKTNVIGIYGQHPKHNHESRMHEVDHQF